MKFLKINKPFYRAWLQSMTKEEIQKEFDNLKSSDNYSGLANAALARSIADWKIGMNGTRAVTAWSTKHTTCHLINRSLEELNSYFGYNSFKRLRD